MRRTSNNEDTDGANQDAERLITTEEAAAILGLAPNTLAKGRSEGNRRHPPHVSIGRAVRYSTRDLSAFIRSRTMGGNSQSRG